MTEKQRQRDAETLEAFIWYQSEFGCPPSLRELAPLLNLRGYRVVANRMQRLVKAGHVIYRPGRHCVFVLASACGRGDAMEEAWAARKDADRPLLQELEWSANEGLL